MTVQNERPAIEEVRPAIDRNIENTVYEIFDAVLRLNPLEELFKDLAKRLIEDLHSNSFMEFDLELEEDQKEQLRRALAIKGNETARLYLANLKDDERSKEIYGVCREKTTSIVDAVLSSIGREINRGAVINALAVQANAKNDEYDEILLRKSKGAGDITIPCNCVLISTNCVAVIKSSCQSERDVSGADGRKDGRKTGRKAAKAPEEPEKEEEESW